MRRALDNGYLFLILFLLTPMSFYVSRNYTQQHSSGNTISMLVAVAYGLIGCIVYRVLLVVARSLKVPERHAASVRLACVALASVVVFPYYIHLTRQDQGIFLTILMAAFSVFAIFMLLRVIGFARLNAFLLIFTIMSIFNLVRAELSEKGNIPSPPKTLPNNLQLTHKPNIYLLFLESMHDRKSLNELFQFDTPEFYKRLEDDGFTTYGNYFGNYMGTLDSLIALLSMKHHFNEYDLFNMDATRNGFNVIAENNVFKTLKLNGYSINLFAIGRDYLFRVESDYVDYTHFPYGKALYDGVVTALRGFNPFLTEFFHRTISRYRQEPSVYADMLPIFRGVYPEQFDLEKPSFFFMHFGAHHSYDFENFYPDGEPGFSAQYRELYRTATEDVMDILDRIDRHDPGAMVILLGDHGSWKYGRDIDLASDKSFLQGKRDINSYLRGFNLEPSLVGASLGQVLTSIRWPEGITPPATPKNGLSHVTLFPLIFCNLAGVQYRSEDYDQNIALAKINLGDRFMAFARDGELLPEWQIMLLQNGRLVEAPLDNKGD